MATSAGDRRGQKRFAECVRLFVVQHFLMDTIKLGAVPVAFIPHLVDTGPINDSLMPSS